MRRLPLAISALLALVPGIVQAAEAPCLSRKEFSELAAYALPSVLDGATERCAPHLGTKAFLPANGAKLVGRYAERKDESWPGAKAAFLKISARTDGKANNLFKMMPDDTMQDMVDLMIGGLVSQEIPTEQCTTIDEFARLLAPLPAENTAQIIGLIVSIAGKPAKSGGDKSVIGKLTICQA